MEVGRVLDELRARFQVLQNSNTDPDSVSPEDFLRQKLSLLGLSDLPEGPLLPDLQREMLRGVGVGLGSQLAHLLGRLAGWHGEVQTEASARSAGLKKPTSPKLIRVEFGTDFVDKPSLSDELRREVAKVRRQLSRRLGWMISGTRLAANSGLERGGWKALVRGVEVASGDSTLFFGADLSEALRRHCAALYTFAEFDKLARRPDLKAVLHELHSLGFEKAGLWVHCRNVLGAGGHLRDPLTFFELMLEASVESREAEYLVAYILANQDLSGGT